MGIPEEIVIEAYPPEQVWTTEDGSKIPIDRMSHEHLVNTVTYLLRRERNRLEALSIYTSAYAHCIAHRGSLPGDTAGVIAQVAAIETRRYKPLSTVRQYPWLIARMAAEGLGEELYRLAIEYGALAYGDFRVDDTGVV